MVWLLNVRKNVGNTLFDPGWPSLDKNFSSHNLFRLHDPHTIPIILQHCVFKFTAAIQI